MKLPFGFTITRTSSEVQKAYSSPSSGAGWGWFGTVFEPFAGAWQKGVAADRKETLLAFSAVFACISLIANDIGKLAPELLVEKDDVCVKAPSSSPFWKPLGKPNAFQNRIQFFTYWIIMKLLYGNVYIFLEREPIRRMVVNMYVLDSRRVKPLIADDGSVFYQLQADSLSQVDAELTLPASEVIHDRGLALFHPLVGVSPIFACGSSATQGIRIQRNSATFFENMSRPSGQLYSPGTVKQETAERLKAEFEKNFSAGNLGRFFVGGDGLKFEAITIPAVDAQLIEQLKWTVEDVARCFHVPMYKIASGESPKFSNLGAMNQDYYGQCLQPLVESIELLLKEGIGLPPEMEVRFDVERGLLRMDPSGRADVNQKRIGAGYLSPNEARREDNLPPVAGGDTPYLQQQNFSLAALAKRDAADPFAKPEPAPTGAPANPPPGAPAQEEEPPEPEESPEEAAAKEADLNLFALALVGRVMKQVAELEPDHVVG